MTGPLLQWSLNSCICLSDACYNSLSLLSYHYPVPLDPLVGSPVTSQRLTSLEQGEVTLSCQSLLTVVKGLHNLRALGLEEVSLSDERVSLNLSCMKCRQSVAVLKYPTGHTFYCLPLQSLTASAIHLIASSIEHHPSLRELTVKRCSKSLVKGTVEGMARRHGVEKLVVTSQMCGKCL